MTALKVVSMDILPNGTPCFTDVVILRQISFFILKAAEPALDHDVICPPAFSRPLFCVGYIDRFRAFDLYLCYKYEKYNKTKKVRMEM